MKVYAVLRSTGQHEGDPVYSVWISQTGAIAEANRLNKEHQTDDFYTVQLETDKPDGFGSQALA